MWPYFLTFFGMFSYLFAWFLTFLHNFLPFCMFSYLFACFLTFLHDFLLFFAYFLTFLNDFLPFLHVFLPFCMIFYFFACFLIFLHDFLDLLHDFLPFLHSFLFPSQTQSWVPPPQDTEQPLAGTRMDSLLFFFLDLTGPEVINTFLKSISQDFSNFLSNT